MIPQEGARLLQERRPQEERGANERLHEVAKQQQEQLEARAAEKVVCEDSSGHL